MAEEHGERLARLEERTAVEIRQIRETLDRLSETMQKLVHTEHRMDGMEDKYRYLEANMQGHDDDFDLVGQRLDTMNTAHTDLKTDHSDLKHFVYSRWWMVATLTVIGATFGGWLIQIAIKAVF